MIKETKSDQWSEKKNRHIFFEKIYFFGKKNEQQAKIIAKPARKDNRIRVEEPEIKARVFKALQAEEALSIVELESRTEQSKNWLKPILNEFCHHFTAGEKRGKYELKPQYKTVDNVVVATETSANNDEAPNN